MKLAIVTGASAGIGLATAESFLEAGYEVVNLSRRPCPLADVSHIHCDLAKRDVVDSVGPRRVR